MEGLLGFLGFKGRGTDGRGREFRVLEQKFGEEEWRLRSQKPGDTACRVSPGALGCQVSPQRPIMNNYGPFLDHLGPLKKHMGFFRIEMTRVVLICENFR